MPGAISALGYMSLLLKSLRNKQGLRRYIGPKRLLLLAALLAFVYFAWDYYRAGVLTPEGIARYRDGHPVEAVALFILVYAASVVAALPTLPLNLAAGYFWGGLAGGLYTTIGVTAGGWISFLMARWLIGQPLAEKFNNKWVAKVQQEFEAGGWKFVAFARLNPVIPTGPLNYLLGLTSLSSRGFLAATFVFLLPPAIAVAYIGDTLQTFTSRSAGVSDILLGIFVLSGAVTFLALVRYASRIYKNRQ